MGYIAALNVLLSHDRRLTEPRGRQKSATDLHVRAA